jgi:phage/plasmid-associated DNA primase
MQFEKLDLLSHKEIEEILDSNYANVRAEIIIAKLKKYMFILQGTFYILNLESVTYSAFVNNTDSLINFVVEYVTKSIEALETTQITRFMKFYPKVFPTLTENSFIKKIEPQLKTKLTISKDIFESRKNEIHYNNGYIDLVTLEFKKREVNKHFVKDFIHRDYVKSSETQRKNLISKLSKIYLKKEDLETILFILGSSLTGNATKTQKILFLLGIGSSGKSTILKICSSALECYVVKLESEALSDKNKNKDKTFSTFYYNKSCRIIWINEADERMNASSFKQFAEGELEGKLLYENGIHNFNHNALPIITANVFPNIKMDSGVQRRISSYTHTTKFTVNDDEIDETKNIFKADTDLLETIINEKLLD